MKNFLNFVLISILFAACVACVSRKEIVMPKNMAPVVLSDNGAGDSELVGILREARRSHAVPAMAAAIVTDQGLQKVAVIGTRKWGTDTPVTVNDMWHLGSDTKIMTATLAAVLVEQGKLSWATTVTDVFPELMAAFNPGFRDVNLLQLLSHVAGLPANFDYSAFSSSDSVRKQRTEAVRMALSGKPLSTPGTSFLYSNLGYIIVGAMIERVCNTDWETALSRNVFAPLKMTSAGYGGLGTQGAIDQPWGHQAAGKPVAINGPAADNPPVLGPAGRVHCTIQDWARFIQDQLRGARGETGLLSPASYRMLQNTHFEGDYALGWSVVNNEWAGGKALTHTGSNTMYLAVAWIAPAKNFAILVCTNEGLDSFGAADEAVAQIIGIAGKQ